jgi:hypothetical protein
VQDEVTVLYHHITKTLVEIGDLRDFGDAQHFREMVNFGANTIIIICQLM